MSALDGSVAIVTGGASGIGEAIVQHLLEAGAKVASVDVTHVDGVVDERWITRYCDVADQTSVETVIASVEAEFGPADILVLCAGIVGAHPLQDYPEDTWRRIQAVNLDGCFYFLRTMIGPLMERRRGRIVMVSSGAAVRPVLGQAAYSASKAGLIGLAKVTALEAAPSGVTCNVVAPGLVATPLTTRVFGGIEQMRETITTTNVANAMRVVLEPDDIAAAVTFFCLPSSRYVTGQTLHVNGGSVMP